MKRSLCWERRSRSITEREYIFQLPLASCSMIKASYVLIWRVCVYHSFSIPVADKDIHTGTRSRKDCLIDSARRESLTPRSPSLDSAVSPLVRPLPACIQL